MNSSDPQDQRDRAKRLRQQAEDALHGKPVDFNGMSPDDFQYLLHELQVHQIELSLQNEELRRVQLDLEISRDLFADLYNFAPAGYCTLSQKGRILNANQTLGDLLGVDPEKLLHRLLSDFVDRGDQDEYYLHCQRALEDHRREESEIRLVKQTGEPMVVRMESVLGRREPAQLMVTISDITSQRQLEVQQQQYAAQVDLQRRLIEQSEMERGELSRNLHDGPIQSLAGLGFSLQIIKEELDACGFAGNGKIEQVREDIRNLAVELRGICNDLRPPVLSRFGLLRAIQEHAWQFQTKHPQPRITLAFPEDPALLPEPVALALFRIYQQALSNILRHAHASDVWVRVELDPQQVRLEIQDNGQGFPGETDWNAYLRQGHLGLVGMKERAEALGGKIEVVSTLGEGTTVQVLVPRPDENR